MARRLSKLREPVAARPLREIERSHALAEQARQGDGEAAESILAEVLSPSPASIIWEMTLATLGDAALPAIARYLEQDPDSERLITALTTPFSDGVLEILEDVCRRTHSPEVARIIGRALAESEHDRLGEFRRIVESREDPMLAAGFRLGELGAQEEPDPQALLPYLQPGMPRQMWAEAVGLTAGLHLPQAVECVGRALASADPEERTDGLHCVGEAGLGELLGEVLSILGSSTSPSIERAAIDALEDLAYAGQADLPATLMALMGLAEACRRRTESFRYRLLSALERDGDVVAVAEDVLHRIDNLRRLYQLCVRLGPQTALAVVPMHGELHVAALHLAAAATSGGLDGFALPLVDALAELQIALLSHAQRAAVQHPRRAALASLGRYLFSVESGPLSSGEQDELTPWAEVLEGLRLASLALAEAQLAAHQPQDDPDAGECSLGWTFSWYVRLQRAIADAQAGKEAYIADVLGALRSSVQREHHARKAAVRSLGAAKLEAVLHIWAELPQACMEEDVSAVWMVARSVCPLPRREFAAAAKLVCEHNLQCALLGVIGQIADASCVPLVIARLDSECDLVADCASAVLVRAGAVAVPALLSAMDGAGDAVALARLMEIVACIEPVAVLDRARSLLGSEDELLAATAARVIGLGGEPADASALVGRANQGPELLRIMALRAIGQLDPDAHVELLKHAVCSPFSGVRQSAVFALGQCSEEVLAAAIADFEDRDDPWTQQAIDDLTAVDRWRDDHTKLAHGRAVLPAPDQYPGVRLLYAEEGPWSWGIGNLTPGPAVDWERYRELLASDPALALAWDVYSDLGRLQTDMIRLLVDICAAEDERAVPAREMLWHVLRPELGAVLEAARRYNELPGGEDPAHDERVQAALGRAAQSCTEQFVTDLFRGLATEDLPAPQEPIEEEDFSWLDLVRSGDTVVALCYQFAKELPAAYGIARDPLPDGDAEHLAAIAAEWESLEQYADDRLGFVVQPRTTLEDLIWYCSQDAADAGTRRSVFSYLVMLAASLPCPPEAKERAVAAVRDLVEPVMACAAQVLHEGGAAPTLEEAQECAEDVFKEALAGLEHAYDGDSIIRTPLRTALGPMLRSADQVTIHGAGRRYPRVWAGFVHGLLERFDDFLDADDETEASEEGDAARETEASEEGDAARETEASEEGDAAREMEAPRFSDLSALPETATETWLLGIDLAAGDEVEDRPEIDEAFSHVLAACSRSVLHQGRRRSAVDMQSLARMLSSSPEEVRRQLAIMARERLVIDGREYRLC